VVAVLAAGWVAWKAMSETGPTVQITFQTAEGLEAGRTAVKYKDVQVGMVQAINLDENLNSVVVDVQLSSTMDKFVTDQTRFWVVRPRVGAGGVSGLGTLFSGAYIALDPSADGRRTKAFKGLEEPPVVTQADPGTSFRLTSPGLGSLSIGAPVYFREIRVGEITQYAIEPGGEHVEITAFVRAPYDQYVRTNTRFWNAGGINLNLGADGISLESASLVSILVGGIAFDTPKLLDAGDQARADQHFPLFSSQRASEEEIYSTDKQYMLAYFDESVRGLSRNSPVELNGMKVGSVADVKLRFNAEALSFRASVLLEIYPDRIREIVVGEEAGDVESNRHLGDLVRRGLRAQLKTGSLLTGARFVNVAIFPGVEQAELRLEGTYEVIPTVPSGSEDLARMLSRLSEKIDDVPFDEIGRNINEAAAGVAEIVKSDELREAIAAMSVTLGELRELTARVNDEMAPAMAASIDNAERVLGDAARMLAPDSPVSVEIKRVLREMADAARSIRSMADYLEQHPEALIRGKEREAE
jgi:paraquat-inducible protein B